MTGISIIQAGFLLLAAARITFMLSVFLFLEQVTGSARLAGLAALVYMANPRFFYFDAQYSYESVALPLAALVLYLTAWRERVGFSPRWMLVVIAIAVLGVVVSHHVTSLVLVAFLIVWTLARLVLRGHVTPSPGPAVVAVIAFVATAGWILLVATPTVGYLAPQVTNAASQVADLLSGGSRGRELFRSAGGDIAPLWERIVGFASAATPDARHRGRHSGDLATVPPRPARDVSLAGRVDVSREPAREADRDRCRRFGPNAGVPLPRGRFRRGRGGDIAAAALVRPCHPSRPRGRARGRHLRGRDHRGHPAVAATSGPLPGVGRRPFHRAERDRGRPMGAAVPGAQPRLHRGSRQPPVDGHLRRPAGHQPRTSGDSTSSRSTNRRTFKKRERDLVQQQGIELVVADDRLTTSLPVVGFYFQRSELADSRKNPLSAAGLAKFDTTRQVSRLFDNGDIRIYDVTNIERAQ